MSDTYHILVVDDETDLEVLMTQRMRREIRQGKYRFSFAHDGVEALEALKANPDIDLVLSDINMPRMDGLSLLDAISDLNLTLRSLVVSAYGDIKNIRTAMNRGAFDFVVKPIDFDDLKITVARAAQDLERWRDALMSRDKLVAIQNELDVARNIQQSILPKSFPSSETHDVFASMVAARQVGGDFYDTYEFEDGRIGVAIADVSDKGVPAAMFMMSSRTLLKSAALNLSSPSEALHIVNELMSLDNPTMMFVTLFYAIYDPSTQTLTYANGGHNPPMLIRADGEMEMLDQLPGVAVGVMPGMTYDDVALQAWARETLWCCIPME